VNNQQTIEIDPATSTSTSTSTSTDTTVTATTATTATEPASGQLVEESLVEEVSIDGMCGVY